VAWLITVVVVAAVGAGYVGWVSTRIERLAYRADTAWAALDAQLVRRAAAARGLAADTGDRELAAAAEAALGAPAGADREDVENALSRALRRAGGVTLPPAGPGPAAGEGPGEGSVLDAAVARVELSRRFYNAAVRDLRSLRGRPLPRVLGLGRRRALPAFFEIDDAARPRVPATG
jgi:hypothetical protein